MKLCVRDYKRDLKILHMRANLKWPYTKIAESLDISKARARQLYMRMAEERRNEEKVNKAMGIGA